MKRVLSIATLTTIAVLSGCAAVQSPIGPSVDTPTRQAPVSVVQVDVVEAEIVTEATDPAPVDTAAPAVAATADTVPYTCEFNEDACFYPTPPPPAEPGWVYRDCEEQGLTSTPTGCGEALSTAPPGTPIYD